MKRIIILAAILTLALGSTAYAGLQSGPRITYGGLLEEDATGLVTIDTLICVFNPNNCALKSVNIHVFDKYGSMLYSGPLMDGGVATTSIRKKGWAWITLGMIVNPVEPSGANKYTWVVTFKPPSKLPDRGAVIEVKEIVYPTAIEPDQVWWEIKNANVMSETALGFDGVGYSPQ